MYFVYISSTRGSDVLQVASKERRDFCPLEQELQYLQQCSGAFGQTKALWRAFSGLELAVSRATSATGRARGAQVRLIERLPHGPERYLEPRPELESQVVV
jgi:hypothetical protein